MTIKPPKPTMADRLLKALGKKRGVDFPQAADRFGYCKIKKEVFL